MELKDRKIKVGHSVYSLLFMKKTTLEVGEEKFNFGNTNTADKIIEIAKIKPSGKSFTKEELLDTYYHELIHAILDEGQYCQESNNESLVEWIAHCLVQLSKQKAL